jgi:hypothetical protein
MKKLLPTKNGERGAAAIIVGLFVLFLGAGFAALAVDLGHLYVARNELQNAADAGALAGAEALYNDEGVVINETANDVAFQNATQNKSERVTVECDYNGPNNSGDIQRGHWSFGLGDSPRGFYPSDSTVVIALAGLSDEQLDEMDGTGGGEVFINAVRVRTRRRATPIRSFFARIFGYASSEVSAEAVAYRGFAGTILPGEMDMPIAICEDSLIPIPNTDPPEDYCTIGRMINSGPDPSTTETGMYTDFYQQDPSDEDSKDPCAGGADPKNPQYDPDDPDSGSPGIEDLMIGCGGGNPNILRTGELMATKNGNMVGNALKDLYDCWKESATNPLFDEDGEPVLDENGDQVRVPIDEDGDGIPDVPWRLTLPVINCEEGEPNCGELIGAVTLEIVWIIETQSVSPDCPPAPDHLGDWENYDPNGDVRWNDFVQHYSLKNLPDEGGDPVPAPCAKMSIYFRPDCDRPETAGVTGGHNFGVLARVPVLVQ